MSADRYPKAVFTEPAPYGYIYAGLRVDPPSRTPLVRRSAKRAEALRERKSLAQRLEALAEVVSVAVYEAVAIPPAKDSPRFDVMILVRTTTPEATPAVETAKAFQDLEADFVLTARNARRIGDIDRPAPGAFLFNHFTAAAFDEALPVWEDIAGWFTTKAGVRDSALLQPVRDSPYVFVNHVRLPYRPAGFFLRLLKPSFRRSVSRRLRANRIGFAAIVCERV